MIDCFTDRNRHDDNNTTISNEDPIVEVLHRLDPSTNEHHSHDKIAEYFSVSTPEGSSTENSILNIGYGSTFTFKYFILE